MLISDRPAEVADRAVPGDWEGDLLIGKAGGSAIGTLIERQSRYVMLLHLIEGRRTCPHQVGRQDFGTPGATASVPHVDRGKEMAEHIQFTLDTGVQVYFCDQYPASQSLGSVAQGAFSARKRSTS